MVPPMTEFPDDDAPISEWCAPLSALMVNRRAMTGASSLELGKNGAGRTGGVSKKTLKKFERLILEARRKACDLG